MAATTSPRTNISGTHIIALSLVVEYVVICGMASFLLGMISLLVTLLLVLVQLLVANDALDARHPHSPWVVPLSLVTAALALLVGGRNYHASFAPYMNAQAGRRYADVPATASANAYADAGVISFTSGAFVDETRALGLRVFGHTYCAAPILDKSSPSEDASGQGPTVQFWAVGLDCCGARGSFNCDDASEGGGRGGVLLRPPAEGVEAISRSVFAPRVLHKGYVGAVRAASVLHGLQASGSPVLLRWVADAESLLNAWLVTALLVWLISSACYLVVVFAAWRALRRKSQEKVTQWGDGRSPGARARTESNP